MKVVDGNIYVGITDVVKYFGMSNLYAMELLQKIKEHPGKKPDVTVTLKELSDFTRIDKKKFINLPA